MKNNLITRKWSRRSVLTGSTAVGLAAGMNTLAGFGKMQAQDMPPLGDVVDEQPFARIEKIAPGVWGVVSTPLNPDGSFNPKALATLCNGGIIAGNDKVIAVDGSFRPKGAAWLAAQAKKLTGRDVTDVIVTHFHADHTGGLAGYQNGATGPDIIATATTNQLIYERYAGAKQTPKGSAFSIPVIHPVMPTKIITDETAPIIFDLGGRSITLDPKRGHTPSDLAIHVDDAPVIFAGDLVWSGLFHNYVDAIPSALRNSVAELLKDPQKIIVTGHGGIAKAANLGNYIELLDLVEDMARRSFKAGKSSAEGAADFVVPLNIGVWRLFNPRYYETAFEAWYRELSGS